MPIIEIEAENSGYIYSGINATYATVHDVASGNLVINDDAIQVCNAFTNPYYFLYRGALVFDTTLLPAGATITAITLSLYGHTDKSDTDVDITIVDGSDLADTFVVADYGDLLDEVTSYGEYDTSGFTAEAYNVITLNAAGIAALQTAITAGAKIRFGLRTSTDIANTTPTDREWVSYYGSDTIGKKPKLTITYNEPRKGQAWIEGSNFHFFDEYNVEKILAAANSIVSNESEIVCHEDNVVYV